MKQIMLVFSGPSLALWTLRSLLCWSGESGKALKERYLCVKRVKRTSFLEKCDQRALKFTGNTEEGAPCLEDKLRFLLLDAGNCLMAQWCGWGRSQIGKGIE